MEFYRNLVAELGGVPAFRKPDNFRLIQGEITRLALEKGRPRSLMKRTISIQQS